MPRTIMYSIMRSRSTLTGEYEGLEVIGKILSSRRLQDLRCSGADAPIVTPERSSPHRRRRQRDDLQARAPPARAGSFRDPEDRERIDGLGSATLVAFATPSPSPRGTLWRSPLGRGSRGGGA